MKTFVNVDIKIQEVPEGEYEELMDKIAELIQECDATHIEGVAVSYNEGEM